MAAMSISKIRTEMQAKADDVDTCFHSVKPKGGSAMVRCTCPRMPGLLTCKMHTKCRLTRKTPEEQLQYVKGRAFKLGEW